MSRSPTFAIIGAAGYIAGKHLDAIYHVNGRVLGACDPHDAVGVLDRYDDRPAFFTEIERFDRWLDRQNRGDDPVDYVVVCSPNYLHESHARLAMRAGSDVIVEKPPCLTERNLDALLQVQAETAQRVNCVFQLRNIRKLPQPVIRAAYVEYTVRRGPWYDYSWKGNPSLSGGVLTNIGIHVIDLLCHNYGPPKQLFGWEWDARSARGGIEFDEITMHLGLAVLYEGETRRVVIVNDEETNLSRGMALHNIEYERIVRGDGWTLESARPAIKVCEEVR